MLTALVALGLLGFVGHLMLWVNAFNRVHATAYPYILIKVYEKTVYLIVLAVPSYIAWTLARTDFSSTTLESFFTRHLFIAAYLGVCLGTLAIGVPQWAQQ